MTCFYKITIYLIVLTGFILVYYTVVRTKAVVHNPSLIVSKHKRGNSTFPTPLQGNRNIIEVIKSTIKPNLYHPPRRELVQKMEERYQTINRRIHEVCQKSHSQFSINTAKKRGNHYYDYLENLILDSKHRLGYCGHPKVGSSTVMVYFEKLMTSSVRKEASKHGKVIHDRVKWAFKPTLGAIVKSNSKTIELASFFNELGNYLSKNNILTFSFVRHPYERLVSAYKEKVLGGKINQLRGSTFPAFINYVLDQYKMDKQCQQFHDKTCFGINPHWRPFNSRCLYCNVTYNVIDTSMEHFNENLKYIILKQNLGNIISIDSLSVHVNPSGGNANNGSTAENKDTLNYFSKLSLGTINQLFEMYRFDFELFDYDAKMYIR